MPATHREQYIQPKNFAAATLTILTDASGDFSSTLGPFTGYLDMIRFTIGTLTNGAADITVTLTSTGETLYTKTNATANAITRLKVLNQDNAAANIAGVYGRVLLVDDTLTVTVAQGGDTKSGSVEVLVAPC